MRYRNTVTGHEIETHGVIDGKNWVLVEGDPSPPQRKSGKGEKKS